MRYMVLTETNEHGELAIGRIEDQVNQLLELDWQPQGGIMLVYEIVDTTKYRSDVTRYFTAAQAMLHPDDGPLPQ